MNGHMHIGRVTIYGRNAMHWGVDVRLRSGGYLSFRLPLPCFGRWWPLYLYLSPNATPSQATWGFYGRHWIEQEAMK